MDHSQIHISIPFNRDSRIEKNKSNKQTKLALNIREQSFKIQHPWTSLKAYSSMEERKEKNLERKASASKEKEEKIWKCAHTKLFTSFLKFT